MRAMFHRVGLLLLLVVSGCTSVVELANVDKKKASIANAELGIAYLAQGKYKVAMLKFKKSLTFDDENVNAHHYIADLYRRLKKNDLARKHFEYALELDSEESAIKNNYGVFLCSINSYDEAMKFFEVVLKDPLYADKGQVYENMGLCVEKQGNVRYAEKYFKKALTFNKYLPSALLSLAQISFDNRDINKAFTYLERHNKVMRQSPQSIWLGLLIAHKRGLKGMVGSMAIKLKQNYPDSRETKLLKKLKLR